MNLFGFYLEGMLLWISIMPIVFAFCVIYAVIKTTIEYMRGEW